MESYPHEQSLWVPGTMPSMNDIIKLSKMVSSVRQSKKARGKAGARFCAYNDVKAEWEERVLAMAEARSLVPFGPSYFTFVCIEPSQKRDPDNFTAGARKLILDAFVAGGYFGDTPGGDSWRGNLGHADYWYTSDIPGVQVFIRPDRCLLKHECPMGARQIDEALGL